MGWDVYIASRFRQHQDPFALFIAAATWMSQDAHYGRMVRLKLWRRRDMEAPPEAPLLNLYAGGEAAPLDGESLGRRLREYHGSDLAVEGWWQVPHRYLRQPPEGEPELVGYRIILTAAGQDYYWPSRPAREIPLIYDAGDYKQFAPALRGQTARLNIEALVEELCALCRIGADTMVGLNGDRSLAPEDLYLCYHRHPEDYGADLAAQGRPPRRPLTGEDILDAVLACEGVSFREADGGMVVYHRDLVEGDLSHFYDELAKLFSE